MRPTPIVLATLAFALPAAAADPAARCLDAKLDATVAVIRSQLGCLAAAVRRAAPVDPICVSRGVGRFANAFERAQARGGCVDSATVGDVLQLVDELVDRVLGAVIPDPSVASRCAAWQLRAGGRRIARSAAAHLRAVRRDDPARVAAKFDDLEAAFARDLDQAADLGGCQAADGAVLAGLFDSGLDVVYATLGLIAFETVHVPSGAEPARTPGSPGVDASAYPKLVTQYGSPDVDLNRATYTRFFHRPGTARPDAILILIPGFEGGAMSFKPLAENAVGRALERGLRLEVWAYDRRGHQLEDRLGTEIARLARDPLIALDWMFGAELGQPLHPALPRRAVFHDTHADTAFMAEWTSLVFSRDLDAIVEAARAAAANRNVFLGGHSAGTGFTARYAATDFDLTGGGPAQPGYAKLRGLVLLEGGGGSTGTPPSADALDRIEDRADGGLFFAVRDDAPRCVDGTPCTPATEATDCAGKGRGKCTPPVSAYAIVPGLLNPRILASAEPGAVQGLDDPDGGQVILQVDQGAPGNNVIAKVPDLATLAVLPDATAEGALGSFIDDDGFISEFATFVRTSVGGPGPVEGGVLTWQDVTEGPFPPALVPDNGPAPTALPAASWGREKEITRIDRVGMTFITPGSNFTDWYYPSAGLGVTAGINLDSTPLSVGRGRRDIENLTQAANVDIPVIAFGGTNGLTPVPGSYLAFAQSIGPCTAPSCSGAPRVVSATTPSPAFPTFGGVAGGFEVVLNEGYAHVDVVTSEDDADNFVVGPLLDFIARNLE